MYRELLMKNVYGDNTTRKRFLNSVMFKNAIESLAVRDEDTDKQFLAAISVIATYDELYNTLLDCVSKSTDIHTFEAIVEKLKEVSNKPTTASESV